MIYLDFAATFPVYKKLINEIPNIITKYDFNPSARYKPALETKNFLYSLRNKFAFYLGIEPMQIIFTSSATEGLNTIVKGLNFKHKNKILVCDLEHKAVLEPLKQLNNIEVIFIESKKGYLEYEDLESLIDDNTRLISLMHVNNETGALCDVNNVARKIKEKNSEILIMSDMVQSFGKIDTNLQFLDFAVMSSHKIGGLKGAGFIYAKNPEILQPLITGGGQEFKLRGGTENILAVWSMAEALKITNEGFNEKISEMIVLKEILTDFCKKNNFKINSPETSVSWIFNFSTNKIFSEVMINYLSSKEIYVSSASACSGKSKSHVLQNMKLQNKEIDTAIRISMNQFVTEENINVFCNEILHAVNIL